MALSPEVADVMAARPVRELVTVGQTHRVWVDRREAQFSSWYEFFPRSEGATYDPETGEWTSGTFRTATAALDRAAAMGFDVAYLPPIHPIGRNHRKGPNNTLTAGPQDPGSPWAIGGPEGGHDTIHPDLGSFEDFDAFVAQEPGTIVANGKHLDRAQYKKQIWSDKFLEAGAQVQYLGAVSVPKDQSEPIQVRFPLF